MSGAAVGRIEIEIDGEGPPIVFLHGLGGDVELVPAAAVARSAAFAASGRICRAPAARRALTPPSRSSVCARQSLDVVEVGRRRARACRRPLDGDAGRQHLAVAASEWVKSLTLFGPIGEPGEAARERLRDRARAARRSGMIAIADPVAAAGLSSSTRADNPVARRVRARKPHAPGSGRLRPVLRGAGWRRRARTCDCCAAQPCS